MAVFTSRAIKLLTPREIEKMRVAGQMVAGVLGRLREEIEPGVTTGQLDDIARDMIHDMKGEPLFLNYRGFPKHICTSVNEQVVHGIPGDRVLEEGDIVGIDCGIRYEKYCGDSALTIPVGRVEPEVQELLDVFQKALYASIDKMRPGNRLRDVCAAVQDYAEPKGYGVVRDFVGHGIGREMHQDPQVPNYVAPGMKGLDMVLKPGLVLALEPMINMGTEKTKILGDKWTVITRDRKLSAHFEHSVAITENGPKVLTRRPEESNLPG